MGWLTTEQALAGALVPDPPAAGAAPARRPREARLLVAACPAWRHAPPRAWPGGPLSVEQHPDAILMRPLAPTTLGHLAADYADLLTELKEELSIPDAPVIVFGGSYGGMLAAWFRIK